MPVTLLAANIMAGAAQAGNEPTVSQSSTQSSEISMPVEFSFSAEFGGKPFNCIGEFGGIGLSEVKVTVSEYKLFVSHVRMVDAHGNEVPVTLDSDGLWQRPEVALLDFENGEGNCINGTAQTNSFVKGKVASGEYTGVAFDIGVPFEINHNDPTLASSPMNLTSMFWNWRGGYRFMRIDFASAKPGHSGGRGWSLHVGSTGCASTGPTTAPSSCANPNRIKMAFDRFDAATDTLVIDPARVLKNVDVTTNTGGTAPGCMSSPNDPECTRIFDLLGLGEHGSRNSDAIQQLIWVR